MKRLDKIIELASSGHTQAEIAKTLAISRQAVSKTISCHAPHLSPRSDNTKSLAAMVGQRFGRLVIREMKRAGEFGRIKFTAECDCGKVCGVAPSSLFRTHPITSCGCAQEVTRKEGVAIAQHQGAMGIKRKMRTRKTFSRFKGVSYNRSARLWVASVNHEHRTYYLGTFDNEISAAQAYDSKLVLLKGDQALTNYKLGLYA